MAAIISNVVFDPLFIVSLLESGERQRRGCTAGNGCSLALRGEAALGDCYGVRAYGNPVRSKQPSRTAKSRNSGCNAAALDRDSCAADRRPA